MPEAARHRNVLQVAARRGQGCRAQLLPSPVAAPGHFFPARAHFLHHAKAGLVFAADGRQFLKKLQVQTG